jgi:glucose dehydrogenase
MQFKVKKIMLVKIFSAAILLVFLSAAIGRVAAQKPEEGYRDWSVYNGGPGGRHFSALDQINRENVAKLQLAWQYDSGDQYKDSEMECNPIIIGRTLYATTPKLRVIALDAATGKLLWSFNPLEGREIKWKVRNRGLTYWGSDNDARVFVAAFEKLYALDAKTGKPIPGFGKGGYIDLREGLGRDPETLSVSSTSPGIVYKDLLIMGSIVSEDLPAAPGDIRAYDARTGKLRWIFHTIPHPGEPGYDTWPKDAWKYTGGVNDWTGLTLDEKRGLVFAATGSAAFDFYGANRIGDDLYANCVLALDAATGKLRWYFQGVKHDVWDRDFPAPPSLVTVERDGRTIDAVAQITKSGFVFVFDRATGKPLFPVEYHQVPPSDVDGEKLAETQPFPVEPQPFARQRLSEDMLTERTPAAHQAALEAFKKLRSGGQFTPPSREGTIIFPGFDGGGEWGAPAFDPETHLLYINANEMAWILRLVPRQRTGRKTNGRELYLKNCSSCHRADLKGTPPEFPSLVSIGSRMQEPNLEKIIERGVGRMPAFASIGDDSIRGIAEYLSTGKSQPVVLKPGPPSPIDLKYQSDGYNKFLDSDGYPAVAPPWGTLNALNLDTGKYVWKIPFGEFPELAAKGVPTTGSENYGGPLVTAGGLLFIAATDHDSKFHAFDKATGKLLWETTLPAAGNATPATYEIDGKQYVVIGAGGGKWGAKSGGSYLAFALPDARLEPSTKEQGAEAFLQQFRENAKTIPRLAFPDSPEKTQSVDCFRGLTPKMSVYTVVRKCGRPDEEVGSGISIWVWHLKDGSTIAIGTPSLDKIYYVRYTPPSGMSTFLLHKSM